MVVAFHSHQDGNILVYIFKLTGTDVISVSSFNKASSISITQASLGHQKKYPAIRLKI